MFLFRDFEAVSEVGDLFLLRLESALFGCFGKIFFVFYLVFKTAYLKVFCGYRKFFFVFKTFDLRFEFRCFFLGLCFYAEDLVSPHSCNLCHRNNV